MNEVIRILVDLDWDKKNLPRIRAHSWEIGRRLALIDYFLGVEPYEIKVRETKNGFHIYITATTRHKHDNIITPEVIVALQLILMSDIHREIMNLRRIIERKDNNMPLGEWNVLFNIKADKEGVKSCEKRTELSDEVARKIVEGYEMMLRMLHGDNNNE